MTSRFHGSFVKDEPKSHVRSFGMRSVARESRSEVPGNDRNDCRGRLESNGCGNEDEADPDLLYRRSKEHFASWDIKDIVKDAKNLEETTTPRGGSRKSRFELFGSNAAEDRKISNGDGRSRRRSGSDDRNGVGRLNRRYDHRGGSPEKENGSRSKSRDGKDGQFVTDCMATPGRVKHARSSNSRTNDESNEDTRDGNLLREIGHFGSLGRRKGSIERRYAGSRSPEQENDRIRAMIDSFKCREEEEEEEGENELASWKSRRGRSFGADDKDDYGRVDRRYVDDLGAADGRRSIDERENGKRKSNRNREYSDRKPNEERGHRVEQRSSAEAEAEEGHRKRSDISSVDRSNRRGSKTIEVEQEEEEEEDRDSAEYSVRRRRRSYTYEGSPEDFDVRIQRYERALPGPRRDPELTRKSPSKDNEVKRRSSLKNRSDQDRLDRGDDQRHSRPLTPPENTNLVIPQDLRNGRRDFSLKDWHENNRQFGLTYLQEHSKARTIQERSTDIEPSGPFSKKEFGNDPESRQPYREVYFGEPDRGTEDTSKSHSTRLPRPDSTRNQNSPRGYGVAGCNGTSTVIKISNSSSRSPAGSERRWRRRDDGDYHDDDHRTSNSTPSRTMWEYREGGVKITDVEEGQPCLQCEDICPGFSPHSWRLNERLRRRHTTPTLLAGSGPDMSPKGPSQEVSKVEVRVSCVASPGAEPQGIRVRIPEPKKRAVSPPRGMRERCPSFPEKDLYHRKSVSLDRRERYPTLSGAEIKRSLAAVSRGRRNPMLDRKNRFPTLSGAELKRGLTIGKCPLEDGLDLSLAPWPGMKWACVRVLHLYCKVFDQFELFELIVRKNCTSCKCPREAHDVCHEEWVSVRARLGLKGDGTSGPVGFDPRDRGLAWAPPGLPSHKVEEYFSMLPDISVPRLGTPGERYRDRQLATQLPKQDLARAYCRHLDPQHSTSADDFMAARNEIALDIGTVQENLDRSLGIKCGDCHESIKYGSLVVSASKLGLLYHPACFRCLQCRELLVDLAYCVHDDALFCERHYAEQLKPRCAACDELIFSGEYTKAMNKDWHSGHFCCWQCDESLTGQRYVLRDEHPYCIKCYESVFANGCEECNKIIGIDSKDLSYKDKHWHEACFLCNKCRVSLVDKQFGSKLDKIYCGNCYDAQFASRCDGCGEIFRAGTKKMEYKTRQWHEKCFCCVVCKNPIGTKSFIPREQEIYCAGCYEDKFATRCVKCNKIITSGGVTYKNEPWHRDCFTCSNCNNSLAGQRFTSRDDKPYCADCFGELFAKRCTACSKPITGIGGTRFISFEDRHWHNDCFICAGCKTSLVGRGFITDGDDIICPECAKQKVM